jgi:hypothetical protein
MKTKKIITKFYDAFSRNTSKCLNATTLLLNLDPIFGSLNAK